MPPSIEPDLSRTEAQERARTISDVTYEVHLDLTQGDEEFTSTSTITFKAHGESTFLDLIGTPHEVVLNDELMPLGEGGRIPLTDLEEHNTLTVTATCRYQTNGAGLHRSQDPVDGRVYLHSQFAPMDARRVFACFDQPDLKARFTLTVKAPEDWVVVSNAKGTDDNGSWTFEETPPLPTYLVGIMAGHYASAHTRHHGLELGAYCRQSLREHLAEDAVFASTTKGLDWFAEVFGRPYPFTKYDQLFVPEFRFGGMENPGCITYNESHVHRGTVTDQLRESRDGVLMHEMAHMWFGDLVTMRWWDDLWLNESFATFLGSRAMEGALGYPTTWSSFALGTKASAYAADQLPTTHPISADITDTAALMQHFDAITYSKGASVLKQLCAWVGTDAFDQGVREYFDRYAFGNAELHDLLACLERASGRDLKAWSRDWLETAGVTRIRVTPTTVEQSGDRSLPSHRMAVAGYDGHPLAQVFSTELDVVGAATAVDLPAAALVLPNDQDLTYALIDLDARSLATVQGRLSELADPLARALCWTAAWEMLRAASLPAADFVQLVTRHAPREELAATVHRLVEQAAAAVVTFGPVADRPEGRAALTGLAREQLARAEPGGDLQLLWVTTLLAHDDDPALAEQLLDGSHQVDGLAVDVELRWLAVAALVARHGRPPELVDEEVAHDPSDFGRRRAAAIRASRPAADDKAAAWEVLSDPAVPAAVRLAVGREFWQPDQEALLRPYADRYLAQLPQVWAGPDADLALSFSRSGFPSTLAEPDVIAGVEAAEPPTEAAARVLLEGLDHLRRVQRTRAVRSQRRS